MLDLSFSLQGECLHPHLCANGRLRHCSCAAGSLAELVVLYLIWAQNQLRWCPQDGLALDRRSVCPSIVQTHCGWFIDWKVVQLIRRIPLCSGNCTRFNWRGWEIHDRYRAQRQLGDALLFVPLGKIYLQLCDAEAVSEIFQRRTDFPRPPEATGKALHGCLMLNVFGPNIGTVSGSPSESAITYSLDRGAAMATTT